MAWDAQHFAVLGAAAVGAAGATLAGVQVAMRQTKTQFRLAERATRVTAYEEALRLCEHLRDWANRTFPILEEGGLPQPMLATVEEQIRARVLMNLHGSANARDAYGTFDKTMNAFFGEAREMQYDRANSKVPDPESYMALETHRKDLAAALTALQAAMRSDLDVAGEP